MIIGTENLCRFTNREMGKNKSCMCPLAYRFASGKTTEIALLFFRKSSCLPKSTGYSVHKQGAVKSGCTDCLRQR